MEGSARQRAERSARKRRREKGGEKANGAAMINTESIRRLPSSVWAINFGDGKNAINPEFLTNLENELDLVEAESRVEGGPRALITYSTGTWPASSLSSCVCRAYE